MQIAKLTSWRSLGGNNDVRHFKIGFDLCKHEGEREREVGLIELCLTFTTELTDDGDWSSDGLPLTNNIVGHIHA
jgi:hypothetical protein